MTLNQLAYDLLNKLEGGRSTNNSYISLDQIKFNIDYYRSLLIHRDAENTSFNREAYEQKLDFTLELITETDIQEIEFYLRSTKKLPKPVRANYKYLLNVYNKRTNKVMPVNNYHRMKYHTFNQYTKNNDRAYLLDDYIYIHKNVFVNQLEDILDDEDVDLTVFNSDIVVRGIFENPRDIYKFNGEDPETIDDLQYPISGDMYQRISQSIINGNLELILKTPNDTKADTLPDSQVEQ